MVGHELRYFRWVASLGEIRPRSAFMNTRTASLQIPVFTAAGMGWRLRLILPVACLHALMFLHDLFHPERFLNADRADQRAAVIQGFGDVVSAGGDATGYLSSHGIVGDWLPHALLYLAGGQLLIIAAQVALALLSVLWVRELGVRLGLRAAVAGAAALLYGVLPHSLVFPHQLSTEALFVPLVIWSFVLGARAWEWRNEPRGIGWRSQASAGLALGAATLLRPITLVWPLIQAVFLKMPLRLRLAYVAAALAPLMVWMGFIAFATGEFSMGRSSHDLGHNLYQRVQRMSGDTPVLVKPRGQRTISVAEYLQFSAEHPVAAISHSARDVAALTFKSGIERLLLDYLDLFPQAREQLQSSASGWRHTLEREGPLAALSALLSGNPALTLASLAGAALFALFMLLAAIGAWTWLREPVPQRSLRLLAAGFVLYIIATAQVVDAAQSRHRAPAEFALCLMAVAGWAALRRRKDHHAA
jgi:hypothetical protein